MLQPVRFYGFKIEPRTIACLPFIAANHTELRSTPAGHVVTAFLEFDHGRAIVASFPACFLCSLDKHLGRWILGAVSR